MGLAKRETEQLTSAAEAGRIIRAGGIVAFPTETVFGLGADATNDSAVERVFLAKGRPSDNPLIVHLPSINRWSWAASELTPVAARLLEEFAPGPLTVVLPKSSAISDLVSCELPTVAIRIPECEAAREVLEHAGVPVAAPSANRSGRPSCTRWPSVLEDLNGRIDAVLCRDVRGIGLESTVVDCCPAVPRILRQGGVTLEQLQLHYPDIEVVSSGHELHSSHKHRGLESVRSPGVRHPHYQPCAEVRLVKSTSELISSEHERFACATLNLPLPAGAWGISRRFDSVEEFAAEYYEFLRQCDRENVRVIFVELAEREGMGAALRDRQIRSAGLK